MRFMLQALSFSPGYDSALESELVSCVLPAVRYSMAKGTDLLISPSEVKVVLSMMTSDSTSPVFTLPANTIQSQE